MADVATQCPFGPTATPQGCIETQCCESKGEALGELDSFTITTSRIPLWRPSERGCQVGNFQGMRTHLMWARPARITQLTSHGISFN